MRLIRCARCPNEAVLPPRMDEDRAPAGWAIVKQEVFGAPDRNPKTHTAEICPRCCSALSGFLEPIPEAAER